jgi:hypothetical protein
MSIEEVTNQPKNNVDWLPGVGDIYQYETCVSTGTQHLDPDPVVRQKEEQHD